VGSEWDPAWQVAPTIWTSFSTDLGSHPHDAPTYARSGYDAISLWARYQTADGRWYFRIDVDGRGGDSDSQTGTAGKHGASAPTARPGTSGVPPFMDGFGMGNSESYKLGSSARAAAPDRRPTWGLARRSCPAWFLQRRQE